MFSIISFIGNTFWLWWTETQGEFTTSAYLLCSPPATSQISCSVCYIVSELFPASSQNVKKPIQSLCTNLFKIRPWGLLIQVKELEKNNGRKLAGFQSGCNSLGEVGREYFLCSFPSLHWIGCVWGGVFSFLVSMIRKKLDSILLLGCALLKWVDVFTFNLSAPCTQFAVWPWLSLSWLASQPWGQEWPHHVKKEGTWQISWAAYAPFSLLCPFLGYI